MKEEIKEKFYSLEELKRTIDCYDGYSDNEEVYYFIGVLRFAYDYITNLQEINEKAIEELNKIIPICIMPNNMLIHGNRYAEAVAKAINILEGKENYEGEKND